jgi:serine/threonine protein kinase
MLSTAAIRKAQELTAPSGGRRLRELLAQGERPNRATLVDWGGQLLEILAHAHARGVLHRHLTEDDVIITAEGRLILTGFGAPKSTFDPRVPPPPEQLAGRVYTARSDLFAAGSLLRRLAFAGALRGGSIGRRDPLLKVLARATFKDPAGRFESAAEMAEALREAGRWRAVACRGRVLSPPPGASVTPFPGTPLRLLAAPSKASAVPPPQSSRDVDVDLWRVLLLLALSLLVALFFLATGWVLAGRGFSWSGEPVSGGAAPKEKPGWIAPPGLAAPTTFTGSQKIGTLISSQ